MISVIGSASSRRTDDCTPMLRTFATVANPPPKIEKTTIRTTRRYAAPGMVRLKPDTTDGDTTDEDTTDGDTRFR
jgi:hypothetical protein